VQKSLLIKLIIVLLILLSGSSFAYLIGTKKVSLGIGSATEEKKYTINKDILLEELQSLGFTGKDVQVAYLQEPNTKNGLVKQDIANNIIVTSSFEIQAEKATLFIFVDDDYLKKKDPSREFGEVQKDKALVISEIIISSLIKRVSQNNPTTQKQFDKYSREYLSEISLVTL
jgi:hypothetical protein